MGFVCNLLIDKHSPIKKAHLKMGFLMIGVYLSCAFTVKAKITEKQIVIKKLL